MMRIDVCLSDVCLSTYIGPKSRTERPRKTRIGTEVAHVTRDSDTTFKVKRSKVRGQLAGARAGAYCGGLPHSLFVNVGDKCTPSVTSYSGATLGAGPHLGTDLHDQTREMLA